MNQETHFALSTFQADGGSQSAIDTFVPVTNSLRSTLGGDLARRPNSSDLALLKRPQVTEQAAVDCDPRQSWLFFAHAWVAKILSRTRGFVQHAV